MITPNKAEQLATEKIQDFVNTCECDTIEDVGNVLMKLLSTTAQTLLATQGQEKAVAILNDTATHIAKPEYKEAWKSETIQ